MTNLFARIYALDNPDAPLPPGLDISSREPSPVNAENLQPVKNWSHPFRDKRDPLMQLTHLAKAGGGFYPLAGNGLWHGGVHFDGGTAGTGDQSSVHCLADGEVVAYRIDTLSPTTTYWINTLPVRRPFSRNFVLVRHRLQAPAIEGCKDTPPSLIFYSLYMHLQDWVQYDADPTITRPPFWSEGSTRYVKDNVNDERVGHPGVKGLNIRHLAHKGQVIGLLPRGAKIQVSGAGAFRRLENTPGPEHLIGEDGALRGYVAAELLEPIPGGLYRVNTNDPLNIRPQPDTLKAPIGELFRDTEVTVSGTGTFLKLERINQYVHYDSLQGKQEPNAFDTVVVLDKPVPIKAGDLIGHIGAYQEAHADRPEHKLHLEVFSSEPVDIFMKRCRTWEQKLPASGRTWLKLVKGTPVVRHQERYNAEQPPSLHHDSTASDGQLLVPKSLLDGLPAECKIALPAKDGRKASNWYRLDKLLHDASQTLLDGWVREEVGVTPWVSPWAWEGFDTLFNFDPPEHLMASFLRATGRLNDAQRARYRATADRVDKGPIQERLYDLIDRNRDGKVTGSEIQTALNLPAHAQSIAQLIVHSDSEWHHTPRKWDALDELLGHSGSTPHKNWIAEKERIREMSWWDQVAPGVGLPGHGGVYHLHPVGLLESFFSYKKSEAFAGKITFDAEGNDIAGSAHFSRVIHWPGTALSGVTLGRGYDMGSRTQEEIFGHMTQAGIDTHTANQLSLAYGLKGDAAESFVRANRALIREISREEQISLFNLIYPVYIRRAVSNYNYHTRNEPQRVEWISLDPVIRDVLVDFVYQGFTKGESPMKSGMNNNRLEMINYIENTPDISQYEPGRGRANYLKRNR